MSSRGNLTLCGGPGEHKVDKAAGASSCHASVEEQHHGALPWHSGEWHRELLAAGKGTRKRRPSFQNSVLQLPVELPCKVMGYMCVREKTIENNSIIGTGWQAKTSAEAVIILVTIC